LHAAQNLALIAQSLAIEVQRLAMRVQNLEAGFGATSPL
jgi:hypothetical protein